MRQNRGWFAPVVLVAALVVTGCSAGEQGSTSSGTPNDSGSVITAVPNEIPKEVTQYAHKPIQARCTGALLEVTVAPAIPAVIGDAQIIALPDVQARNVYTATLAQTKVNLTVFRGTVPLRLTSLIVHSNSVRSNDIVGEPLDDKVVTATNEMLARGLSFATSLFAGKSGVITSITLCFIGKGQTA